MGLRLAVLRVRRGIPRAERSAGRDEHSGSHRERERGGAVREVLQHVGHAATRAQSGDDPAVQSDAELQIGGFQQGDGSQRRESRRTFEDRRFPLAGLGDDPHRDVHRRVVRLRFDPLGRFPRHTIELWRADGRPSRHSRLRTQRHAAHGLLVGSPHVESAYIASTHLSEYSYADRI